MSAIQKTDNALQITVSFPVLIEPLKEYFIELACENQLYQTIECQQWTTTDQAELVYCTESIMSYVDYEVSKLEKVTSHSYIAKAQPNI